MTPACVIGVDGCRGGWIAVTIASTGERYFSIVPRFADILQRAATRVMIDMPIGLPETGYRDCDLTARQRLGAARSRVFLGARRPLLQWLDDYPAANAWAKADGKGLSRQCWHILPKIAEIDRLITPADQDRLREAHPELVFQRLAGGHALPPKKSRAGQSLRRDLVAARGFAAIDDWLHTLDGARADDLLDACALAIAAEAPAEVLRSSDRDARGLRMEIWC